MRKWNAILSMCILVLFIVHAVLGSLQMMGANNTVSKVLSWVTMGLVAVHVVLGIILTVQTLKVSRATGVSYFKENRLFWARRISGLAIMVLLVFHMGAFSYVSDGFLRLHWFHTARLVTQILLVASIAVHVISNVRPSMIALGIRSFKKWALDILIILAVLLLFMAVAVIVYYLRWNM